MVDTPETNATNVLPSNEHSMKCDICQRNENRSSNSLVTFEMFIFDMMTHLTKKMFSLIALQTSSPVVQLKSSIISWLLSRCKLTKYLFYLQIYGIINSNKMEDESNKSVMDRSILWFRASPSMCHCQENYCNSHREFQIIEKNNQENRSECEGTVFCCLLILLHFTIGV